MKILLYVFIFLAVSGVLYALIAYFPKPSSMNSNTPESKATSIYEFTMKTINGVDRPLADYAGKVVLIVNVASECGYTRQYEGLQKLHELYKDKGLVVAGFPSNEFGGQEPGTNEQIQTFCQSKFGVSFDMFEKIIVKGNGQHPLYSFLTKGHEPAVEKSDIRWNFEKFLISKNGTVIKHYRSGTGPLSNEMIKDIELAISQQ